MIADDADLTAPADQPQTDSDKAPPTDEGVEDMPHPQCSISPCEDSQLENEAERALTGEPEKEKEEEESH